MCTHALGTTGTRNLTRIAPRLLIPRSSSSFLVIYSYIRMLSASRRIAALHGIVGTVMGTADTTRGTTDTTGTTGTMGGRAKASTRTQRTAALHRTKATATYPRIILFRIIEATTTYLPPLWLARCERKLCFMFSAETYSCSH